MTGTDWSAGYVTDVGYTYGYYQELNPARVAFALNSAGLHAPEIATACELGFGQGLSVNIHAAAGPARWHATDFNPSQAAFAQALAAVAGAGADLADQSFAEFCARPDLPDFDYIGLHGIWTWINDDNRRVIVDFVRRKLRVGGVFYNSYNTFPGWAAVAPMRHLLTEHAETMGAAGHGIVPRIDGAIAFAERLLATNPTYARANPQVTERLKKLKEQNRNYLAHEYFNRDWRPMHFAEMVDWLAPAKVEFACSAHVLDQLDAVNLTADQQALLKEIADPRFRQTVRDFCVNQQFRRDYWVKGPRRLAGLAQAEALRRQRFVLTTPAADVSLKTTGSLGEATLTEAVYAPIVKAFADHRPRSLGDLEAAVKDAGVGFAQVAQAALVLAGKGDLAAVQPAEAIEKARAPAGRLNQHILGLARDSSDINYLASPLTGGGVTVDRFAQLFLLARSQAQSGTDKGPRSSGGRVPAPAALAQFAWGVLSGQGQRLLKDGKTLETAEENLAELTQRAGRFVEKQLPILTALGVTK